MTASRQIIANRFEIQDLERDLLGRGGMGDVYRGVDLQTGQAVAIKALRPEVVAGDPNALARFRREGEALRQLNHPNIVQVVDGIEEEGAFGKAAHYLVMEYVPGGSLRDLLDQRRRPGIPMPDGPPGELSGLPIERTVEIALDVADALTRAHRLGILHRDLKPANVLLAEDGTPRLTDFGHAHLATAPRLTQTGTVVGTVLYLSPEALRGETPDARADIWAFGVMLYEMLAGEVPFPGETFPEAFMAILDQPVPDVQRAAALRARPQVPDALADLVYRMLEKDRNARIPSVRLVGAELEAVLQSSESGHRPAQVEGWQVERTKQPRITEGRFATPTPSVQTAEQPPSVPLAPHNLPTQLTPFVGRKAELAALDQLLQRPDVRLVTILGAGGMGKTRLALEAARAQLDRYEDGVYLVALAPLRAAENMVPAVAAAVGLDFYPGGDPRQQLLGYLRGKRMLLVFDNFEHILAGAELVSDILRTAPEVVILATSRARLNLQEEHRYPLGGMDAPEALPPAEVDRPAVAADLAGRMEYSAVQLFVQSAQRADPGFALETENLGAVVHICHLVGGMPLGILLAAAWVEMLTAEEIADEIQRSLDFLESDLLNLPERQRSMRAVYSHSWNLLTSGEREALQALSVFRGGFIRGAAQEVTGASLRDLRTLVNRSLLQRTPAGRFEMHELLRQYAKDKLGGRPEIDEATRERHSAFYLSALAQWGEELKGARQRAAIAEIETDLDNIRAAWEWAVDQGQARWLLQAMDGLCLFVRWHRRFEEGTAMCGTAATALGPGHGAEGMETEFHARARPRARDAVRVRVRARALAWQSYFAEQMGDIAAGDPLAERSLALLDRLDEASDPAGLEAYAIADLASAPDSKPARESPPTEDGRAERALALWAKAQCTWQKDIERTGQLYERSLALFRALDDRWWVAGVLASLSAIAAARGLPQKAERLARESLATYRSLGDRWGCAAALSELGRRAMGHGRLDEAERLTRQALAEAGGSRGWIDSGVTLARIYLRSGRFAQALQGFERRAALFGELGLEMRLVLVRDNLLWCHLHLGQYERAHVLAQSNLETCMEAGYRLYTGRAHRAVAGVALVRQEPSIAQDHLTQSVRIYREAGGKSGLVGGLTYLGYAERALGHQTEAEQHLAEALRLAIQGRFWLDTLELVPGLALLLADEGQTERAVELYALAAREPYVVNSRWFEDVAGRNIAAAAAALPPDVAAAAVERGRARDLWATAEELLAELGG